MYHQPNDGVEMGSQLGTVLVKIFLAKLENESLSPLIDRFNLYYCYIDDILRVTNKDLSVEDIEMESNNVHPAINFTYEFEQEGKLYFLDAHLSRETENSLLSRIKRKKTWTDQYTNFSSLVPIKCKRKLLSCLTSKVRRNCSEDALDNELKSIQNKLRKNDYPDIITQRNMQLNKTSNVEQVADKKPKCIRLGFKGDVIAELKTSKWTQSERNTSPAAELQRIFANEPLIPVCSKDRPSKLTSSYTVYRFGCICGATYLDRTAPQLSSRIKEHSPKLLANGGTGVLSSGILPQPFESGHSVNLPNAFAVLYQVPLNNAKSLRLRMLAAAEAIGSEYFNLRYVHKSSLFKC